MRNLEHFTLLKPPFLNLGNGKELLYLPQGAKVGLYLVLTSRVLRRKSEMEEVFVTLS